MAERRPPGHRLRPGPAVQRAQAAGAGEQRGGLGRHHLQALVRAHPVPPLEDEVEALPHGQVDQRRQQRGRGLPAHAVPGAVLVTALVAVHQHVEDGEQQPVRRTRGRRGAEHPPSGLPVSPHGVAVQHVVVEQGEVVHHLHRGGGRYRPPPVPADRPGAGQCQRRADELPAPPGALPGPAELVRRHLPCAPAQPVDPGAQLTLARLPGRPQQPLGRHLSRHDPAPSSVPRASARALRRSSPPPHPRERRGARRGFGRSRSGGGGAGRLG